MITHNEFLLNLDELNFACLHPASTSDDESLEDDDEEHSQGSDDDAALEC